MTASFGPEPQLPDAFLGFILQQANARYGRTEDSPTAALPTALTAARWLADIGEMPMAAALLDQHLSTIPPADDARGALLAEAYLLLSRLAPDTTNLAAARQAYEVSGPPAAVDPLLRLDICVRLGELAHQHGDYPLAVSARQEVHDNTQASPRREDRVRAQLLLADSLHHAGRCGEAVRHADIAWHSTGEDPSDPTGLWAARTYTTMLLACARHDDIRRLLPAIYQQNPQLIGVVMPVTASKYSPQLRRITAHAAVCARRHTTIDQALPASSRPAHPGRIRPP